MINSQLADLVTPTGRSISKGMGDQFSAAAMTVPVVPQYIKGDG